MVVVQAQGQGRDFGERRGTVGGEETAGFGLAGVRVEDLEGLDPGSLLGVVEFAQVEERSLMDGAGGVADIFHHAPVAMHFAVFLTFGRPQKSGGQYATGVG
jgi:hypothetical protein